MPLHRLVRSSRMAAMRYRKLCLPLLYPSIFIAWQIKKQGILYRMFCFIRTISESGLDRIG